MKQLLAILAIILATATAGRAELMQVFYLDASVRNADLIAKVRFEPDGKITPDTALFGPAGRCPKSIDPNTMKNLATAMDQPGRPIQGMIFARLAANQEPAVYFYQIVGFLDDAAFQYGYSDQHTRQGGGGTFVRSDLSAAQMLKSVDTAIDLRNQIAALAARPRSDERAKALIDLALKCRQDPGAKRFASFVTLDCAAALAPVDPAEQAMILQQIHDTRDEASRCAMIELAAAVPLNRLAFEPLAKLADIDHPLPIRAAAIAAIARIDPAAATNYLARYLDVSEPLKFDILRVSQLDPRNPNPRLMHALERLCNQYAQSPNSDPEAYQLLLAIIQSSQHPRLVVALHGLSNAPIPWHRTLANGVLHNMTELPYQPNEREKWEAWWKQALPVIEVEHDLSTPQGRAAWRTAYNAADPGSQKILLLWWNVSPKIDDIELVNMAADPKECPAAMDAMLKLWRNHSLSPNAEALIMKQFWKYELVEAPAEADLARRNVYIHGTPLIDLPRGFEFRFCGIVALDGEPKLDQTTNAIVPEGRGPFNLGSIGCYRAGKPVAKGILRLWQSDPANGGKDRWSVQVELGPITLRDSNAAR